MEFNIYFETGLTGSNRTGVTVKKMGWLKQKLSMSVCVVRTHPGYSRNCHPVELSFSQPDVNKALWNGVCAVSKLFNSLMKQLVILAPAVRIFDI